MTIFWIVSILITFAVVVAAAMCWLTRNPLERRPGYIERRQGYTAFERPSIPSSEATLATLALSPATVIAFTKDEEAAIDAAVRGSVARAQTAELD